MAVGTIFAAKELAVAYQPLLLAEFTFLNGDIERVASHPLNVAEGGFRYGGYDWLARVMSYNLTATQALSESGIDYTPQVDIELADVAGAIWAKEQTVGFKGATVTLTFVFWNVGHNEFSADSLIRFVGVCGSPQNENGTVTVTATSLMNMSQAMLPQVRIQKKCPWIFPLTAEHRQDAADDESSQWYFCGYSVDAEGSSACGNMNGEDPYKACNGTYGNCLERLGNGLNITKDSSNRHTGRFGGIQWAIPTTSWSRGYVSGKYEEVTSTASEAKYGDLVPLHYGEGWTDPVILTTQGSDANFTTMHLVLGWGKFTDVSMVVVNGTIIPHTYNDTEMPYVGAGVPNATEAAKSGWWVCLNNGDRNGSIDPAIKLSEQPDSYGNLCVLKVVVPRKLADSSSVPRVQVLARGPALRQYRRVSGVSVSNGVATVTLPSANTDLASNDPNFRLEITGNTLEGINGVWTGLTNWTYGPPGTVQFNAPGCPDGTGTGGALGWIGYTDILAPVLLDVLTWANWRYNNINLESFVDYSELCRELIPYKDQFGNTSTHPRYTCSLIVHQRRSAAEIVRGLRNAGKCILYLDANGKLAVKHKGTLASQQPAPVPGSNHTTPVTSVLLDGSEGIGHLAYDFNESNVAKKSDKKTPSLSVTQRPVSESANRVTVNYQDRDNRYISESLTIIDAEDVARVGQEIVGNMSVEGINNADQGRRAVGVWMAEGYRGNLRPSAYGDLIGDTGGTTTYEWETTFKVVHLNIGDLCRLTYQHLGVSNQLVRIIKIQPTSNFSRCKITALHHNDLWYVDTFGQEDAPIWRSDFRNRELRPAFGWCPDAEGPVANNSMVPFSDWTFSLAYDYWPNEDGSASAKLWVGGRLPVNVFSADVTPPFLGLQGTTSATGGAIPGGATYWYSACAKDAQGGYSAPSRLMAVAIPAGTDTNTATVPVPYWDADTTEWVLFGGRTPLRLSKQAEGSGQPASITVTAYNEASAGIPDSEFNQMVLRVRRAVSSGCWTAPVTTVTASSIQVAVPSETGFTVDQWAGHDITLLGQRNANAKPLPVWSARVAGNTEDTLALLSPAPDTAVIAPGDVVVMRFKPIIGSDEIGNYIEDPNLANALNPEGLEPGAEKGRILFFIAGTAKGQSVKIKDNTETRYYIEGTWLVEPDASSRFIVLEPVWCVEQPQVAVNNSTVADMSMLLDVNNETGKALFVQAFTVDGGGDESSPADSPFREIYVFGDKGSGGYTGAAVYLAADGNLAIGSDLAPIITLHSSQRAVAVRAEVKQAPTGAALTFRVMLGAVLWMALTIPAGQTTIEATSDQLAAAADLAADTRIKLDITAVGTTSPGTDLTVTIFI
ncbi:phage tail protein [uncultured Paludibaculum sp.]|uniref:phage tail protein n=1 Tax=uncultured Paludibaculum sp. TaxID=1765020 RepID=UPI002AAA6592|nr:phage tail protein [uncultured Paludibaculum sp.]